MRRRPLILALLVTVLGCGRTTSGDGRADADPPYAGYPRVLAGAGNSCLLDAAGHLTCWGHLLDSLKAPPRQFKSVDFELSWCSLERDGTLACWPTAEMNAVGAFPPGRYRVVSTRGMVACGIRLDRSLVCWGDPHFGVTDSPSGLFQDVSVGGTHACAIRADGTLVCWGSNAQGQATPPRGRSCSSPPAASCPAPGISTTWSPAGALKRRSAASTTVWHTPFTPAAIATPA